MPQNASDGTLLFWVIGCILFFPAFACRNGLITLSRIIYAYPIWIVAGISLGLPLTGIVSTEGYSVYGELTNQAFISSAISYLAFLKFTSHIKDRRHAGSVLVLHPYARSVLFILWIPSLAVAYPAAFGLSDDRFGSAGSLAVVLATLLLASRPVDTSKRDIITIGIAIVSIVMIFRGERADFILITSYLYLAHRSKTSIAKILPVMLFALTLGIIGGLKRAGVELTTSELIEAVGFAIVSFGTAVDVAHVYLSAVWYYANIGPDVRPLANAVASYFAVPTFSGVSSELNFVWILRDYINNVGGGTFYVIGEMAAGPVGTIVAGALYGFTFKKLHSLQGDWGLLYIAFFIMQFRIQWYGVTYYGNVFLCLIMFISLRWIIRRIPSKSTEHEAIS